MPVAAVDVAAVGDETVGAVMPVDAAVVVDVTAVDVAAAAAVCAVDAVPVAVDVSGSAVAAVLQTFPDDAASVAGQQGKRFDCL